MNCELLANFSFAINAGFELLPVRLREPILLCGLSTLRSTVAIVTISNPYFCAGCQLWVQRSQPLRFRTHTFARVVNFGFNGRIVTISNPYFCAGCQLLVQRSQPLRFRTHNFARVVNSAFNGRSPIARRSKAAFEPHVNMG